MTRFAGEFGGDVNIASFMSDRPDFDKFTAAAVGEAAENDASQAMRNAFMADAGMRAQGLIARTEANADVIRAGGEAKRQMYAASGLEGIGSPLGKAIRGGFGGGSSGGSGGYGFGYFNSRGAFGVQ